MPPVKNPPADMPPAAPDAPPAPTAGERPGWVDEVLTELRAIPGKIRANIGDDDRRSIAEEVHKLFEPHFVRDDAPPPDNEPAGDEPGAPPATPHADDGPGEKDSLARRLFGRY